MLKQFLGFHVLKLNFIAKKSTTSHRECYLDYGLNEEFWKKVVLFINLS